MQCTFLRCLYVIRWVAVDIAAKYLRNLVFKVFHVGKTVARFHTYPLLWFTQIIIRYIWEVALTTAEQFCKSFADYAAFVGKIHGF